MSFLPSFDRPLVGRIREYISLHRWASSEDMAEYLQKKFPSDYGKRKRNAFRKLVRQVHRGVVEENKLKANDDSGSNDLLSSKRRKPAHEKNVESTSDSEKEEILVEYTDTNSLNSSVMSMYKKKRKSVSAPESPAATFSYIDCPMVPGNEILAEKQRETNNHEMSDSNAVKDAVSSDSKTGTTSDTSSVLETKKSLASNVVVSNTFINDESETRLPGNRHTKKRKKNRPQEPDYEITGEKSKTKFQFKNTELKFKDVGGNKKTLTELLRLLLHVKHPAFDRELGVEPLRGVLLHGPPGCGKSLLASAIAGELDIPMLKIAATEIVTGVSGESEGNIREIFELATASAPCVIFFDEIDAITQKREHASKDMERRIVSQLLTCLDDLSKSPSQILVVGATNCPDSIDPALRRDGRFSKEICLGHPNEKDREDILRVLCKNLKLEPNFNFALLARLTPGFVGADLMSLCREATMSVLDRVLATKNCEENMDVQIKVDVGNHESSCASAESSLEMNSDLKETTPSELVDLPELTYKDYLSLLHQQALFPEAVQRTVCIKFVDFKTALPNVQPSAKREGFATVPDVTWDDLGALEDIRKELSMAILAPVRNPRLFSALGLTKPRGILLAGPPGCGKTSIAKAVANESGLNFLLVNGPELLNKYVGESEKAVRKCFERARYASPCVIFFDELDSLCPTRVGAENGSTSRVVNQMLTELDGVNARGNVFVMGATNRPDIIDPAVLRPGRIEKSIYVGLPDADDRAKILRTLTKNGTAPPMSSLVSFDAIARDERCARFTGADLFSLVREAAENVLAEHISYEHVFGQDKEMESLDIKVSPDNFEQSWKKVKPSVSVADELRYREMKRNFEIL